MMLIGLATSLVFAANDPVVDQEITVYADKKSDRLLRQIHRQLRQMGYRPGTQKGNKTIFEPIVQWKPTLIFSSEGLVVIKRSNPRFEPWVKGSKDNLWRYLSCLPPFTPMCIQMQSWLMNKRKFESSKSKLLDQTKSSILAWQTAIAVEAHEERIGDLLPNELSAIWTKDDKEKATAVILEMWANRTCNTEGHEARKVIGDFIHSVIQLSQEPITSHRLQETEKKCVCDNKPRLDRTPMIE